MADGDNKPPTRRRKHRQRRPKPPANINEVFVLTTGSSGLPGRDEDMTEEICLALESSGCKVQLVNTARGWIAGIRSAFWIAKRSAIAKLVIIDAHPIALVILRCLAAPRLCYLQRSSQLYKLPVFKCIHQVCLRLADDVLVQSKTSADLYQTMFCNCKAPKILYPCIDIGSMEVDETLPIQKVIPSLSKYTNIYLTYGTFEPDTNFDLVIDAFEIFHNKVCAKNRAEKIRLVIAGNLDVQNNLQKTYHSYLRERLIGQKSSKDIFLITKLTTRCKKTLLAYSVCAVFANTSTRELLEALFVGRPIIATQNIITKEMLPKRAGFRLPPSARDFAKALLFLHGDAQLAEKMGHNAKVYYAQYFSYGKFARRINDFIGGNFLQCKACLEFYGSKIKRAKSTTDINNSCSQCTGFK